MPFKWFGEVHKVSEELPEFIDKDSAAMKAIDVMEKTKGGDALWVVIDTACQKYQGDAREPFMRAVLEEVSMRCCASTSKSHLLTNLEALCKPIMPEGSAGAASTRQLERNASAASDASTDYDALDRISLVPKTQRCAAAASARNVPEALKDELRLLHDIAFFRSASVKQLKAAHKVFHDPKAARFLLTAFASPFFSELKIESVAWLERSQAANEAWTRQGSCRSGSSYYRRVLSGHAEFSIAARDADRNARLYLATVALATFVTLRKTQFAKGNIEHNEFLRLWETCDKAIRDLQMLEATREFPDVISSELARELAEAKDFKPNSG